MSRFQRYMMIYGLSLENSWVDVQGILPGYYVALAVLRVGRTMPADNRIQPLPSLWAALSSRASSQPPDSEIALQAGSQVYRLVLAMRCWDNAPPLADAARRRWLSAAEHRRFEALTNPKRRIEFLYGRVAAKAAVCCLCPHTQAGDWSIVPGVFRQPVVHGPAPLAVSIAHTRDCAAALAFPAELFAGVDIERRRPDSQHVIRSQMTARERQMLAASSVPEAMQLTLAWSAKEALSKALRMGLLLPFRALGLSGVVYQPVLDAWLMTFRLTPSLVVYAGLHGEAVLALALPRRLAVTCLSPIAD